MATDLPPGHCNAEDILCSLPFVFLSSERYSCLSSSNKLIYRSDFFFVLQLLKSLCENVMDVSRRFYVERK